MTVTLHGGDHAATFHPELGMLGTSLRWRGRRFLSVHGGLAGWRAGRTTGMPLLAPWANRLDRDSFVLRGAPIDLRDAPVVHRDPNGLPMHGTLLGAIRWRVVERAQRDDRGWLVATFEYTDDRLLAAFPFPHELTVRVTVSGRGLEVVTELRPIGDRPVPVSFGWHPYFRLPSTPRGSWTLRLPDREHVVLDARQIPTGEVRAETAESVSIRSRSFDDGYRLGADRRFVLADGVHHLAVSFGEAYSFAQVYAPAGRRFVAVEPMTAPTNALVTGQHPTIAPGGVLSAAFEVRVGLADPPG